VTLSVTTDRTLFRRTVIAWIVAASGIPAERVIWAAQSTPRPPKPYATIQFPTGSQKFGIDEARAEYNASTEAIERITNGPRATTAQIEMFSDPATTPNANEAFELLENAMLALDTVGIRDSFRAAKIGVLDQSPARRMDEQLADRWERRALAEITFTYSGETFDDGGGGSGDWIETIPAPTEQDGSATYGT
jgi:hypothetical protein